ncbi:MAG: hypothetical protein K0Q79_3694 [Flavipsychrobacter sp.]|jgi:hypothetical protein|nr:hypothetical protein [Flavipsychrobacter sp.]
MKSVNSLLRLFKIVAYSALGAIMFFSCKKNNPTPKTVVTTELDPQIKRNYFKVGTYWIYKDTVSGDIDSAYVTANSDSLRPAGYCDPHKEYYNEVFDMRINVVSNSPGVPAGSAEETWIISGRRNGLIIQVVDGKGSLGAQPKEMILARYPVQAGYMPPVHEGCVYGGSPDSAYVKDVLPSFTLNGRTFNNTIVSGHMPSKLFDPAEADYVDYFYLSEDAGVVKMILAPKGSSMQRVLELQRYHIIK